MRERKICVREREGYRVRERKIVFEKERDSEGKKIFC